MYRFLFTPRWLGLAALSLLLAVIMAGLGDWQLHRYHARAAINDRIDASATARPVPLASLGPQPPSAAVEWTRVEATGRYDQGHETLARGRTLDGEVGYEVLTPLLRTDGPAVLVDRGWVAPPEGGALVTPKIAPVPSGDVTVVGRVHRPESGADTPVRRTVRRISPAALRLPYPVYGGYVTLDSQTPPAGDALKPVPPEPENAWQNAGYVVQWWAFAGLTLFGYGYLARREAHPPVATGAMVRA